MKQKMAENDELLKYLKIKNRSMSNNRRQFFRKTLVNGQPCKLGDDDNPIVVSKPSLTVNPSFVIDEPECGKVIYRDDSLVDLMKNRMAPYNDVPKDEVS